MLLCTHCKNGHFRVKLGYLHAPWFPPLSVQNMSFLFNRIPLQCYHVLLLLLLLYMSIIMVVLSHYCCRTTLQCQWQNSHNICPQLFSGNTRHVRESIHGETLPKQHSLQFLTEGDQSRRIPDMSRQRVPGSCCSCRESVVAQCWA